MASKSNLALALVVALALVAMLAATAVAGGPVHPVPVDHWPPSGCNPAAPATYVPCGYTWEHAGELQEAGIRRMQTPIPWARMP